MRDGDGTGILADTVQIPPESDCVDLAESDAQKLLKEEFRRRFKRGLMACSRDSSVEESLTVVFRDTLHEVPVSSKQAGELYVELAGWVQKNANALSESSHRGLLSFTADF